MNSIRNEKSENCPEIPHQINQDILVAILNEHLLKVFGQEAVIPVNYLDGDSEDVLEEYVLMTVDLAALTVMLVFSLNTTTVLPVITTAGYGVVYSF
jgi:hypothetical protein